MSKFLTIAGNLVNLTALRFARIVKISDADSHALKLSFSRGEAVHVRTIVGSGQEPTDLRSALEAIVTAMPGFVLRLDTVVNPDHVKLARVVSVQDTDRQVLQIDFLGDDVKEDRIHVQTDEAADTLQDFLTAIAASNAVS